MRRPPSPRASVLSQSPARGTRFYVVRGRERRKIDALASTELLAIPCKEERWKPSFAAVWVAVRYPERSRSVHLLAKRQRGPNPEKHMTDELLMSLYIFALAGFVGHYVIESVPPLLHTPLMAGTNAISGIALVGALVVAGSEYSTLGHDPRHHRRGLRQHQYGRRVLDYGPHAQDVQEQGIQARSQEVMSVWLNFSYLVASLCFIMTLQQLGSPKTARRGVLLGVLGMTAAVLGTALLHNDIVTYKWIALGFILGSLIGTAMSFIPMTKMPERIALSHCFGGLAAALVGIAEYHHRLGAGHLDRVTAGALGLEVYFGLITFTGR